MPRPFRNHFLRLCLLSLLTLLAASGCAGRRAASPPPSPPAPAAASAAAPSVKALPFMGHAIQVGAFAKVENAIALSAKLRERGLAAYYYRNDQGLYRVRFGNYPRFAAASAVAREVQRAGLIDVYDVIRPESYPAVQYAGQPEVVRRHLVDMARQFIGVPYNLGDAEPGEGFDCSGLTMMVYQLVGYEMSRIAKDQFQSGRAVDRKELMPGDLVFFSSEQNGQVSHVGIYQGDGRFIHAPRSGKTVSEAKLSSDYFHRHYLGARRYL